MIKHPACTANAKSKRLRHAARARHVRAGGETLRNRVVDQETGSLGAQTEELHSSADHDAQVEPKADALDVRAVENKLVGGSRDIRVRGQLNLGEAGDAGANLESVAVLRQIAQEARDDFRAFGPRADQTHVAA